MANRIQGIRVGNWTYTNGLYVKETVIEKFDGDINLLCAEFKNNVSEINQNVNNMAMESRLRHRKQGEEQSDFVADLADMGGDTPTHSHYTKEHESIEITLPDGEVVRGAIRVANHVADIGKFMEKNSLNFCISIVVGEKERVYPDIETDDESREVHIFEYILPKDVENKERVLMNIADRIVFMKSNGWNISTDVGIRNEPRERSNKEIKYIKESYLRKIIREKIEKYLKRYEQ